MKALAQLPAPFYGLAVGDLVTKTGDYVYRIGIPLLLLHETGSAVWAGAAFATQQIGVILAGAMSGPVIDRRNPRSVMLVAVGFMALLTAAIPMLTVDASVLLVGALGIGFCLEVLNFTYRACLNSLTPILVVRDRLPDASAALSVSKFVSKTAGPALAGVMIAAVGPSLSLLVDAASFAVLFLIVLFVRVEAKSSLKSKGVAPHFLRDIADGWHYIARDRTLVMLNVMNFIANLGYVPLLSMFVIHLTATVGLTTAVIGVIYAVDGVAALLSGLAVPAIMRAVPTGRVIAWSCLGLGAAIGMLAVVRDPVLIGIGFFLALACAQMVNRVIFTHWQMTVDPNYLARVFGMSSALESLATPAAAVGAGIATMVSSSGLFAASGSIVILAGCVGLLSPAVRLLDSRVRENSNNELHQGVN